MSSTVATNPVVRSYLESQMVYVLQARDMIAMTTLDSNGLLPLHHALRANDASLGAIKLLARGNKFALRVADRNIAFPLHIACKFSSPQVVKFLLDFDDFAINHRDAEDNSTLHYACLGGNCGAVKLLLKRFVTSVSERNRDNKLPIHLLVESAVDREHDSASGLPRDCKEFLLMRRSCAECRC